MNPNDQGAEGCSVISSALSGMSWRYNFYAWEGKDDDRNLDGEPARAKMKAIHLLAKHGAKWFPKDDFEIKGIRRSLLKMKPDYAVEFAWIMSKYASCTRQAVESLFASRAIRNHVSRHQARLSKIFERFDPVGSPT